MAIKPNFKKADIDNYIKKKIIEIDRKIIARLQVLGEMCVARARDPGNNDPSGFPIKYAGAKHLKPLRQRKITQEDKDRSPTVAEPEFGDFITWTGNLINSISYFIVRDGQIINSDPGSTETESSRSIASKRASEMRRGYGLIVVAGAQYALYVESQGYDVLTSTEIWATKELPKLLKQLDADKQK